MNITELVARTQQDADATYCGSAVMPPDATEAGIMRRTVISLCGIELGGKFGRFAAPGNTYA